MAQFQYGDNILIDKWGTQYSRIYVILSSLSKHKFPYIVNQYFYHVKTSCKAYLQFLSFKIIIYRYIMFGRGICEKYQSRDENFPEPNGE